MEASFNGKVVLVIDDKIQKVDGDLDCYMFNNLWFDLSECSMVSKCYICRIKIRG